MARIRTIKPSFAEDQKVARCSAWAQLLWIGMWWYADDKTGVCPGDPRLLRNRVFPLQDFAPHFVEGLLVELLREGLIRRFFCRGEVYYQTPNFRRHQFIARGKEAASKYPSPDEDGVVWDDGSPSAGRGQEEGRSTAGVRQEEGSLTAGEGHEDGRKGAGRGQEEGCLDKDKDKDKEEERESDSSEPDAPSGRDEFSEECYAFVRQFREDYLDNVDAKYGGFKNPIPQAELKAARSFLNDPKWTPDRIHALKVAVMTDQVDPLPGKTWRGWAFQIRSVAKFWAKRHDLEADLLRGVTP